MGESGVSGPQGSGIDVEENVAVALRETLSIIGFLSSYQ